MRARSSDHERNNKRRSGGEEARNDNRVEDPAAPLHVSRGGNDQRRAKQDQQRFVVDRVTKLITSRRCVLAQADSQEGEKQELQPGDGGDPDPDLENSRFPSLDEFP